MKPVENKHARWEKALRFLTGGGIATLAHWLVMVALIRAGIGAVAATATGATVGLAINYLAQHRYTFRSGLPHRVAFTRYLASAGLGWSLNLAVFSAVYAATGAPAAAQLVATATATFANYLLAAKFVFQEEQTHDTL